MKTNTPKQIPLSEYKDMVYKQSEENHIWLNAFSCVSPSDEFLKGVGRMVLDKLNHKDCLIPGSGITSDIDVMRELSEMGQQLILRVNKS